jgi:hypothetical protein
MPTARDIALIFLSLEALVIALIPLALLSGLAYGVYLLHGLVKVYLQKAQVYAQQVYDFVEQGSKKVAEPFIWVHAKASMVTAMIHTLTRR